MTFEILKECNIDPDVMTRLVDQSYSVDELYKKLKSKSQLKIKYGVDVTAPFMHLGHAVNLWLMRHFQEKGHKVIFLIGDFTTRIGDPTGKSKTRPVISREDIDKNADDFINQVSQILLTDKEVFEVRRNTEWFDSMGVDNFLSLLSMVTHARLIQRDMFQKRISENKEIFMHEMLYPILQGYDSYMLESDLTIVGSDQLFNEMMGRTYQEKHDQEPQVVITTKITPGIDGGEKQSKSLGNYIAISDTPRDKFGKAMSIPDHLIVQYMEVYTAIPLAEIKGIKAAIDGGENPMVAKKTLAQAIVELYHGKEVAVAERSWFDEVFSKKKNPQDIATITLESSSINILEAVATCCPEMSRSHIRRLIQQNAVKYNDEAITSDETSIEISQEESLLKVGKRKWFNLVTN